MAKRGKRPKQGTHSIRSVERESGREREGARLGQAIVDVLQAIQNDPDVAAYSDAQDVPGRDWDTIKRLLPVLRDRYGGRTLLKWHRVNRWATPR